MTQGCNEKKAKSIKINLYVLGKSCLLVNCHIHNFVHKFLVDAGSVASILSKDVFMSMTDRPKLLETDITLTAADG